MRNFRPRAAACLLAVLVMLAGSAIATAAPGTQFPPFEKVSEGYTKVVSTADGARSYYTLWTREKDGQMLAALPPGYDGKKFFMAMTVASGEDYAGLQAGDMYVYWKRYDKRLALMEPNIEIKSTGDAESRSSVQRLFTDRVILDVPIVTMAGGSPVIDMDALLLGHASKFFSGAVRVSNPRLVKIAKAKAFPKNVEIAFEVPTSSGRLQSLHYSLSDITPSSGYRPRKADTRIGYFTTTYSDFGKYKEDDTKVRYINRWNLEKADPSLQLSPPKEPIVFYIEHTTPVRYRRWVRQGILYWNKAFEKVGISNAIEVYYQDKRSGAHMEKDPEDVRYNFIRWLTNNQGTAIGPSRVHPETGEILDADIILTDGWIRHFWSTYHKVMPKMAMEGISPETLAWLADHPNWDPRVRLAPPVQREHIVEQLAQHGHQAYGGHPIAQTETGLIGDEEYDGLAGRTCQINGMCTLSEGRAFDVAMFRMLNIIGEDINESDEKCDANDPNEPADKEKGEDEAKEEDKDKPKKPEKSASMIDGMPESFIGPLIADLTCHEVGHTLGLRHNFKASSVYKLSEINSEQLKDSKPFAGSIMDYLPVNIKTENGQVQGNYAMIGIGPYDEWAIEYGYTPNNGELPKILSRVAEPELRYATDEDTLGPDPLARRYDFSAKPLEYARSQMDIVKHSREKLLEKYVQDGESWSKARKAYEMTLSMQLRSVSMMANWLGGAFVHRDKKGDPNARLPIEVVQAEKQREALDFVLENTFRDDAYGLTPDLLRRMTVDKWFDDRSSIVEDVAWPVHDRIMGIQASTLAMLMYPSTLGRIYDNEFMVEADKDALTLPELLDTISDEVWREVDKKLEKRATARKPMISSLRRNLQQEHVALLMELTKTRSRGSAAYKPIADLAIQELRRIKVAADKTLNSNGGKIDPYTRAHLKDVSEQIKKALDARYLMAM